MAYSELNNHKVKHVSSSLLLFMFFCLLFTCKEAEKGKNTRLVKVWEGKASAFPSCFICTIQEIDAIHLAQFENLGELVKNTIFVA